MNVLSQIESILFVASKPLSFKAIAKALGAIERDVAEAVETLMAKFNRDDSGIAILRSGDEVQMASAPAHADAVERFVKSDVSGELTKAQLETLTVIAYRAPATRPEIEQIRGVNCAVILRNLLLRGLVAEHEDAAKMAPAYALSLEAMRQLGITNVEELPEYDALHRHEHIEHALLEDDHETNI